MKHIPLSLVTLFAASIATSALADTIDIEEARQNATAFLYQSPASSQGRRLAPVQSQMEHVYTVNTSDGAPALYVFITGDRGYVIASANDEAKTILGYSTEGTFDPENIPDGMRFLFNLYAEEIGSIEAAPASARKAPRKAESTLPYNVVTTDPIEPLLKTRWGQMQPYNRYCPIFISAQDNGGRSATGCAVTALAQIMRYHEHPKRGFGSIQSTEKRGVALDPVQINYYEHTYNWDLMYEHRDNYPWTSVSSGRYYNESEPSVHNVAQLLHDVGIATRTEYSGASNTANTYIIPALLNFFDYDPSIQLIYQSSLASIELWNDIIIDELKNQRPVYLEGIASEGTFGHAFVCDGYDGNGLFHINWGWDGTSNDYFAMTALNPSAQGVGGAAGQGYSNRMALVCNIMPNRGEHYVSTLQCFDLLEPPRPTLSPYYGMWVASEEEPSRPNSIIDDFELTSAKQWFAVNLGVSDMNRMDTRVKVGILAVKPDGTRDLVWDNGGAYQQIYTNHYYNDLHVDIKESWKVAGTRIYYVYQRAGENDITYLRNQYNSLSSYSIVQKNGKLYAAVDRLEKELNPDVPVAEQKAPFFKNELAFDYNTDPTRLNDRVIGSIGIQDIDNGTQATYNVDPAKVYRNMTDDAVFTVKAGATIKPSITWQKGSWMHGYFYIDRDKDGYLSCNPGQFSQDGTDVASFSYWTGDVTNGAGGKNSLGTSVSNETFDMPNCKAPTEPGTYYVRFKIDWNCIDPAGNAGTMNGTKRDNYIVDNGGYIVDAKLIVTSGTTPDPDPTPDPELVAARAAYEKAVADYNAFAVLYANHENADVRSVISNLAATIGTNTALPETSTKETYSTTANSINTLVAAARTTIEEILANVGPVDPNASNNAKLAGINITFGSSASSKLQLYPAFDPDTHIYLARRLDTDIDNPGSCWVSPYYRYNISGTAQDGDAIVSGPITMQPRPDWNHLTLTCTAADGKTAETYHIIMVSNSGGDATPYTYTISDLSMMIHLLGPKFGYTDNDFSRFINKTKLQNIVDKILNKQ